MEAWSLADRMTTYLNKATNSLLGTFPAEDNNACQSPCSALCGDICTKCSGGKKQPHAMPSRVLLSLLFPVKIMSTPSVLFLFFYLLAAFIQVYVLLYLAQIMVYWMWSKGTDPDNAAIPYLTAIGDLIGTSLLALAFITLEAVGDDSLVNLEESHHHEATEAVTEAINATISSLTGGH